MAGTSVTMRRWTAALTLGIGACLAGTAWAETVVKPLVELGTETRYDDDPYLNGKGEVFSKVSPKLGGTVDNERLSLKGWYAADVVYKAVAQEPELDHRAAVNLSAKLTHRLTLKSDLELWRVEDPTSLPRTGLAAVPVPIFYSTAGVGLDELLAPRWTLQLRDRNEVARIFKGDLPTTFTQTPSLALRFELTHRDVVTLGYRYQAFLALPRVVGQTHAGILSIDHQLSKTWHVYARGGPMAYLDGFYGRSKLMPVGEAGAGWHGALSELDLLVGHDVAGAAGYAAAVWTDYAELDWAVHPLKKVTFYLGGGAFRNGAAPDGPLEVWGYSGGAGVGYAVTPTLQARLDAQRIHQVATGAQALVGLNRNIVGVQLHWVPTFMPREL